ncbi:hypothetical protein P3T36_006188 [Kitasatospora sp. MAP12-15]|uniref:hypothetical protein n=1 Tax=unclassified Kitasatospora TaxID=2633591 RepID=UPI0024730379|nr:hypothetical protein [Kitasatospora sp. MAP12-44]MDH6110558.1 hypothetical protein [Kitasatospora sp. MAP12-44]
MTSPFIPMDTPNPPPDAPGDHGASGLPHVCPPAATTEQPPVRVDPGAVTTARLRAGLASRLRSAYEQGARLDDLAAACHRPVAEVRELLTLAGADPDQPPAAADLSDGGLVPAQRDGAADALDLLDGVDGATVRPRPRVRRPAPPRRTARSVRELPDDADQSAVDAESEGPASDGPAEGSTTTPGPEAPVAPPAGAEARLGILLGSAQRAPEPPIRVGDQRRRRVAAQVIKVGTGTTLAVLPSWRTAIAVSVPTELLLEATGLSREELLEADLSVLINSDALHDRELRMRDWQVGRTADGPRRSRD